MKINIFMLIGLGVLALAVLFGLIQFVPYGRDHTNPPVVKEPNWDSPRTRQLAVRACFDCHSNESVWPTYSNIAPISWLVQRDVNEGRRRLNFSNWRGVREVDELSRTVLNGDMPPGIYLLEHPSAKLTAQERQELASGLVATARNSQ
jgi:hypothetical protein